MSHTVFIGIGSNLGEREKNCTDAVRHISMIGDTEVIAVSNWYNNPALLLPDSGPQPDFINGAIKIFTPLTPHTLFIALKNIEATMGRIPSPKWAPRLIDLDVLFYDDLIIDEPGFKIPHPEIPKRIFVLKPMCDIEPSFKHPLIWKTVKELFLVLRQLNFQ